MRWQRGCGGGGSGVMMLVVVVSVGDDRGGDVGGGSVDWGRSWCGQSVSIGLAVFVDGNVFGSRGAAIGGVGSMCRRTVCAKSARRRPQCSDLARVAECTPSRLS
ncbi:hypothetical protein Tco_0949467 [Tanacetum coccineum]